jgi:hypothetical protein
VTKKTGEYRTCPTQWGYACVLSEGHEKACVMQATSDATPAQLVDRTMVLRQLVIGQAVGLFRDYYILVNKVKGHPSDYIEAEIKYYHPTGLWDQGVQFVYQSSRSKQLTVPWWVLKDPDWRVELAKRQEAAERERERKYAAATEAQREARKRRAREMLAEFPELAAEVVTEADECMECGVPVSHGSALSGIDAWSQERGDHIRWGVLCELHQIMARYARARGE